MKTSIYNIAYKNKNLRKTILGILAVIFLTNLAISMNANAEEINYSKLEKFQQICQKAKDNNYFIEIIPIEWGTRSRIIGIANECKEMISIKGKKM